MCTNNYKEECSYQPGKSVLKNGMVLQGSKLRGGDSVIFNILRSREEQAGWVE